MSVARIIVTCGPAPSHHVDVEIRDQLLKRHHRFVVRIVCGPEQTQLLARVKDDQDRPTGPRSQGKRLGDLEHGHGPGTVVVRAVIHLSFVTGFQVIVMCAENYVLILELWIGAVEYAGYVLSG